MVKIMKMVSGVALASAAVLGATTASSGAADTGTPPSLAQVQAKAATAITMRVNDLNAAITKAQSAKNLGSDASSIIVSLQADIGPLQALGSQIAADTTAQSAQAAAATIYSGFRVFYLVLPAAHLAGGAASQINGPIDTLTADLGRVGQYVTPTNAPTIDPLIADATNQLSSARRAASGVLSSVLAVTPAQWNADNGVLSPSRTAVQGATTDIKTARSDLQQIRVDLASTHAAGATTTTS